jgi:hypothetical protein
MRGDQMTLAGGPLFFAGDTSPLVAASAGRVIARWLSHDALWTQHNAPYPRAGR